jgi:hypothetical protein
MVGDGHAMGVAAEILQHIFGTTEGAFQVDHPGSKISPLMLPLAVENSPVRPDSRGSEVRGSFS